MDFTTNEAFFSFSYLAKPGAFIKKMSNQKLNVIFKICISNIYVMLVPSE